MCFNPPHSGSYKKLQELLKSYDDMVDKNPPDPPDNKSLVKVCIDTFGGLTGNDKKCSGFVDSLTEDGTLSNEKIQTAKELIFEQLKTSPTGRQLFCNNDNNYNKGFILDFTPLKTSYYRDSNIFHKIKKTVNDEQICAVIASNNVDVAVNTQVNQAMNLALNCGDGDQYVDQCIDGEGEGCKDNDQNEDPEKMDLELPEDPEELKHLYYVMGVLAGIVLLLFIALAIIKKK